MIFHDALGSLKNDFSRSFFYWLTFLLTTTFSVLFFSVASQGEIGFTLIHASNDVSTTITIFSVVICMIEVFFANDFFIKTKSKALAIQLICGAKFVQLAEYLLYQTFILLALAIPCGILLALGLIPVTNTAISMYLHSSFIIQINSTAIIGTAFVVLTLIFWTTYLNMAFAYRNNASTLLNERSVLTGLSSSLLAGLGINKIENVKKAVKVLQGIGSIFLFIAPLAFMFRSPDNIFVLSLASMAGFLFTTTTVVIPGISKLLKDCCIHKPVALTFLGFLRTDIRIMRVNVILLVLSSVLLISTLVTGCDTAMLMMMVLLSYIVINILLSLAVMFKFSTDILNRKKYFMTMDQLGYFKRDLNGIILAETTAFYVYVIFSALIPIGFIFALLSMRGMMETPVIVFLICSFLVPMLVCYLVTLLYYFKTVKVKKENIQN
ncbi:MAG: hypothetical protein U0J83_00215 [Bulleidia sp.]|nr:hypothetical protein [Bulleidia sp.]